MFHINDRCYPLRIYVPGIMKATFDNETVKHQEDRKVRARGPSILFLTTSDMSHPNCSIVM